MLLALPLLIVSLVPDVSTTAVVWVYGLGILADLAGALGLLGLSLRYRARAARGELFAIPLVTPLADRFFRPDR